MMWVFEAIYQNIGWFVILGCMVIIYFAMMALGVFDTKRFERRQAETDRKMLKRLDDLEEKCDD